MEYLPKVYERRAASGLDEIVGRMAGVVIQVEHGDAVAYLAELAAMGPYRVIDSRLTETHRVFLLQSQPDFPRLVVTRAAEPLLRGRGHPLERAVPAVAGQAQRPLHRRGLLAPTRWPRSARPGAPEHPVRLRGRPGQRPLLPGAPHLHLPLGLHLQPGRLRRRRPRRPRRPRAGRALHPLPRGAGERSTPRPSCRPSTASPAWCWGSTTWPPASSPASARTPSSSTSPWSRTTSGGPTTSPR